MRRSYIKKNQKTQGSAEAATSIGTYSGAGALEGGASGEAVRLKREQQVQTSEHFMSVNTMPLLQQQLVKQTSRPTLPVMMSAWLNLVDQYE